MFDNLEMRPYKNLNGNSNVKEYSYGLDYIVVVFANGGKGCHYVYTYDKTGRGAVEMMKKLADSGKGLGGMLASKPYHKHAKKW